MQSELDAAQAELSLKDADVADLQYARAPRLRRDSYGLTPAAPAPGLIWAPPPPTPAPGLIWAHLCHICSGTHMGSPPPTPALSGADRLRLRSQQIDLLSAATGSSVRRPTRRPCRSPFPLTPFPLSPFPLSPFPLSPFPLSPFPLSPFPLSPFPLSPFNLSVRRPVRDDASADVTAG